MPRLDDLMVSYIASDNPVLDGQLVELCVMNGRACALHEGICDDSGTLCCWVFTDELAHWHFVKSTEDSCIFLCVEINLSTVKKARDCTPVHRAYFFLLHLGVVQLPTTSRMEYWMVRSAVARIFLSLRLSYWCTNAQRDS